MKVEEKEAVQGPLDSVEAARSQKTSGSINNGSQLAAATSTPVVSVLKREVSNREPVSSEPRSYGCEAGLEAARLLSSSSILARGGQSDIEIDSIAANRADLKKLRLGFTLCRLECIDASEGNAESVRGVRKGVVAARDRLVSIFPLLRSSHMVSKVASCVSYRGVLV